MGEIVSTDPNEPEPDPTFTDRAYLKDQLAIEIQADPVAVIGAPLIDLMEDGETIVGHTIPPNPEVRNDLCKEPEFIEIQEKTEQDHWDEDDLSKTYIIGKNSTDNSLKGTSGSDDVVLGWDGNDKIMTHGNDDEVIAGKGNDKV